MLFAVGGVAAGAVIAEGAESWRRRQWSSVRDENRLTVKRMIERVAFAFYRAIGEKDQAVLDHFDKEQFEEAIAGLAAQLKDTGERLAASSADRHRASSGELYDAVSPHLESLLGRLLSQSIALDDRNVADALESLAQGERHWARAILLAECDMKAPTVAWNSARNTLEEAASAYSAASGRP